MILFFIGLALAILICLFVVLVLVLSIVNGVLQATGQSFSGGEYTSSDFHAETEDE